MAFFPPRPPEHLSETFSRGIMDEIFLSPRHSPLSCTAKAVRPCDLVAEPQAWTGKGLLE